MMLQPVRFYYNSGVLNSSALTTYVKTPEEQIAAFEKDSLARADHLPINQQSAYRSQVRAFVTDLRSQLMQMRVLIHDVQQIQSEISKTIGQYSHSLEDLYAGNTQYDSNKREEEEKNRAIAQQLRGTNVAFASFSPKTRQGLKIEQTSPKPHSFQASYKKDNADSENNILMSSDFLTGRLVTIKNNENDKEFKSCMEDLLVEQLNHHIEEHLGKPTEQMSLFLQELFFGKAPECSKNPIRDKFVSAGVGVGYINALPYALGGFTGIFASLGSKVVANFAKETAETVDPLMEQLRDNMAGLREFDEMLAQIENRPSVEASTYLFSAIFKALQAPNQLFEMGREYLSDFAIESCDKVGLTEKNVIMVLTLIQDFLVAEESWREEFAIHQLF